MFVIVFQINDLLIQKLRYLKLDQLTGKYLCWCDNINDANFFSTMEEVQTMLVSNNFVLNDACANIFSPPPIVYDGLKLSNDRKSGRGAISVRQIVLNEISSITIVVDRDKPLQLGE